MHIDRAGAASHIRPSTRMRRDENVLKHPAAFALRTLKAFRANQGYLLAGAIAYNALLSIVPLLILILIVLTHFVDQGELLATLGRYLELLVPGQSKAIVDGLALFLSHRDVVGWLLVATLIVFSSFAFTVLENAMSVIFFHRVAIRRRRFLVSALIPFCYILLLGIGLLVVTFVSGALEAMGRESIDVFGRAQSLAGISVFLLYLVGVVGEILILTSIYIVMPVGPPSWRHALIGGVTAGSLWELTRHVLVWYFSTLSQVNVVYGPFATTIVVLLSLEIAALVLLLGAQVIAEYERGARGTRGGTARPLKTG